MNAENGTRPLRATEIDTPMGSLAVVVDPDAVGDRGPTDYGAVVASGFTDVDDQVGRLAPTVRGRGVEHVDIPPVRDAVSAYLGGDVSALDRVSVSQPGGAFMQTAWSALRTVHAGETTTYAGLAARSGSPRAVRAAGSACARNLVAPFVPCHRVLRSDGGLGGYYYGTDIKQALLVHEAAAARRDADVTSVGRP